MSIEQKINYQLNKYPGLKRVIKRIYQRCAYTLSKKIKSEGEIYRLTPQDGKEYFFGYYDKSPWDISERYVICLRASETWRDVSPRQPAEIVLIDTLLKDGESGRIKVIATTNCWNVQQGCMLQWLGPEFDSEIIYNDYRDGKYCAIIRSAFTEEERVISAPVYSVSKDGKMALTLDFSRLYNLRPGYGYYNIPEITQNEKLPQATCIWKIDLQSGKIENLLSYTDFYSFLPRSEMESKEAIHKVNHIMISPDGKRFMVLYRWFVGQKKYTRLITCNVDGADMYLLLDDDMVSHCYWKDNQHILAYANKKNVGTGYYLLKDKSTDFVQLWHELNFDGHPSYSSDCEYVTTDSYPNRARISHIYVMKENEQPINVAKVFAPFKYDNDTRCDLHPRWSPMNDKICFDSVFEGKRGLYYVKMERENTNER